MIVIDIIFLVLLIISIAIGIKKGLIKQAGNISAVVLAFMFSLKFYVPFSLSIQKYITIEGYFLNILSFAVLFVLFGLLFFMIVFIIKKSIHSSPLIILDKIGGVVFSLAIFLFIMIIILYGLSILPLPDSFQKSLRITIAYKIVDFVVSSPGIRNVYPQ